MYSVYMYTYIYIYTFDFLQARPRLVPARHRARRSGRARAGPLALRAALLDLGDSKDTG